MYKYVVKRILMMAPVLLGVTFIVFLLMYFAPGDPVKLILGENAKPDDVLRLRQELGLEAPFLQQFFSYVGRIVFHFDFGTSYVTKRSVMIEILERFHYTARLAVLGTTVSVLIGLVCGVIAATKQYSVFDNMATAAALVGVSVPSFWLGLMLIIFFALNLGLLPASGSYGPPYWILPTITLGTSSAANIMRMTRSSMLEVIRQDYIRTARAKGQTEGAIIFYHSLKNALIPVITVIGIQFGNLLGGSVVTESVFAIPGIGKYMIDAIKQRDFPVVGGGVLFLAIIFGFINLLVDILYSYIDPRIKSQYQTRRFKGTEL
jgi:peptide/nickel transport system permease protein